MNVRIFVASANQRPRRGVRGTDFIPRLLAALSITLLLIGTESRQSNGQSIDKSESSRYYIAFCARPLEQPVAKADERGLSPGHAFVVWAADDAEQQICASEAYGFYPESSTAGVLSYVTGPVAGSIFNESLKRPGEGDCRLLIEVDPQTYSETLLTRMRWGSSHFRLTKRDCVTFAAEISESLGLITPTRSGVTNLPEVYVEQLAELNREMVSNGHRVVSKPGRSNERSPRVVSENVMKELLTIEQTLSVKLQNIREFETRIAVESIDIDAELDSILSEQSQAQQEEVSLQSQSQKLDRRRLKELAVTARESQIIHGSEAAVNAEERSIREASKDLRAPVFRCPNEFSWDECVHQQLKDKFRADLKDVKEQRRRLEARTTANNRARVKLEQRKAALDARRKTFKVQFDRADENFETKQRGLVDDENAAESRHRLLLDRLKELQGDHARIEELRAEANEWRNRLAEALSNVQQ